MNFLLMKMFVFNTIELKSPGLGLLKGVFFSLRFMSCKTWWNLKRKMPYFGSLGFKVSNARFLCMKIHLVKAILGETRQISLIDPQYFYRIIADRKSNSVAFKN